MLSFKTCEDRSFIHPFTQQEFSGSNWVPDTMLDAGDAKMSKTQLAAPKELYLVAETNRKHSSVS